MKNKTTNQAVTNALSKAGFVSAKHTSKEKRSGYRVRQVNAFVVGILSDSAPEGTCLDYSQKIESTLTAAGFAVSRPYPDATILAVKVQ